MRVVHTLSQSERAERAEGASLDEFPLYLHDSSKSVLVALARNRHLREAELLQLLERKDLPQEAVREIAPRKEVDHSYRLKLSLVCHPRTPRRISIPLLKFLFLFDLLKVCMGPAVPADIKRVAEEALLARVERIPKGEKVTLARRGTGRIAANLLLGSDRELRLAALENPFLGEAHLLKILSRRDVDDDLIEIVASHPKWTQRYSIRLALVRHPLTTFTRVRKFVPNLTVSDLNVICQDRRISEEVRDFLSAHCRQRLARGKKRPRKSAPAADSGKPDTPFDPTDDPV